MWDDSEGHHTQCESFKGKTRFVIYDRGGKVLTRVIPRTFEEEEFYMGRLDAGDCFICENLRHEYDVQC